MKTKAKNKKLCAKKPIGEFKIKSMRDYDACEITIETDDNTFKTFADLGKTLIKNDDKECFGYIVKRALEESMRERKKQ